MIAIVYPQFYGVGGIARYLDSFLRNLPENSPQIYLITSDQNQFQVSYKNVKIIHLPSGSEKFRFFYWGIKARQKLKELHKRGFVKIVILHIPPFIPILFLPKYIPTLVTAHSTYLGISGKFEKNKYFDNPWSNISVFIKILMEKIVFYKSKSIIILTDYALQQLKEYNYKKQINILPNGVDLSLFEPDHTVKKSYDVIAVGRIEKIKGSRALVDYCIELVKAKSDVKICIVGYGDDEFYVRLKLGKLVNNIDLKGKVPFEEVQEYYRKSRVYVSTSFYEGLPGTCLEAMALELPVVVWNRPFYHGLVINNKVGHLAETGNVAELCNKTLNLLNNEELAYSFGVRGREHLRENYDWKKISSDIVSVALRSVGQ